MSSLCHPSGIQARAFWQKDAGGAYAAQEFTTRGSTAAGKSQTNPDGFQAPFTRVPLCKAAASRRSTSKADTSPGRKPSIGTETTTLSSDCSKHDLSEQKPRFQMFTRGIASTTCGKSMGKARR
mmetsp:Transcript_26867/g.59013  ORF Transcript_26867/g.59013 Transcript_26867/m.59013 type:complete len:124 (+) Transcript_26867:149-520(+)